MSKVIIPKPNTVQAKCIENIIEKNMQAVLSECPPYLCEIIEGYFNKYYCGKHTNTLVKKEKCYICHYIDDKQDRLENAIRKCQCQYHEDRLEEFEVERELIDEYGWDGYCTHHDKETSEFEEEKEFLEYGYHSDEEF